MSSRVGTAIPASRSTALSSAAVGFTRSIQTAPSGSAARSTSATFFSEDSEGTNTDSMEDSGTEYATTQQDLARFWQALHDGRIKRRSIFVAAGRWRSGTESSALAELPQNKPESRCNEVKKTQPACRNAGRASKVWNYDRFRR